MAKIKSICGFIIVIIVAAIIVLSLYLGYLFYGLPLPFQWPPGFLRF